MGKSKKPVKNKSKPRANKYDEKIKINGSYEDLVKVLVTPKQSINKR